MLVKITRDSYYDMHLHYVMTLTYNVRPILLNVITLDTLGLYIFYRDTKTVQPVTAPWCPKATKLDTIQTPREATPYCDSIKMDLKESK